MIDNIQPEIDMHIDASRNTIHFSSPADMAAYAKTHSATYDAGEGSWYGYQTADQTVTRLSTGHDKGVDAARKMVEKFMGTIELSAQTLVPEVAGAFPVIPAYLGGDPECFMAVDTTTSAAAPLTVLIDTTCSASFSAADMLKRGTAMLALVMALAATRPVRLELFSLLDCGRDYVKEGDSYCFLRCDIATAPLDLATAAYALCDVSVARRVQYGILQKAFDSPLRWAEYKDFNARDPRHPDTMAHTLKLAGFTEQDDVLYIPAAYALDPASANPEKFVLDMFEKFRGDRS